MEIRGFIWVEGFVQKNVLKHNVYPEDIEDFVLVQVMLNSEENEKNRI